MRSRKQCRATLGTSEPWGKVRCQLKRGHHGSHVAGPEEWTGGCPGCGRSVPHEWSFCTLGCAEGTEDD